METKSNLMSIVIEKTFCVLDTNERNRLYRYYPKEICQKWIEHPLMVNGTGIDVEFALGEEEIENNFTNDVLSCGIVTRLFFEDSKLMANVKFKINDLTKDIYEGKTMEDGTIKKTDLNDLTIVPKGEGTVKNQKVQDDYELFGFNLVWKAESSFTLTDDDGETEEPEVQLE